ncbi:hypothetical protein CEXT_352061 [Caerostris extrusa]|uniref:Uncharacterized protein n=1 Tax=Caerostris extrusa TaxID=172846 RepID=A0AAV4WKH8_CAEEX|nr:hypothetical protein CEXT_352061 [Caerostris extrusa]
MLEENVIYSICRCQAPNPRHHAERESAVRLSFNDIAAFVAHQRFLYLAGIRGGRVQGLNRLNHLNLHGNRITTLGGEVRRLEDLEYLTVSSNRIRTLADEQIPDGLKCLNLTGGLPSQFSARSSFISTSKTSNIKKLF